MSNVLKNPNIYAGVPLILVTALGSTACSTDGPALSDRDVVPDVTHITICDGANLRNWPDTREGSHEKTLDFGDASGACVNIPVDPDVKIYELLTPTNGNWVGIPPSVLKDGIDTEVNGGKSEVGKDTESEIIWVNGQKITIVRVDGSEPFVPRDLTEG